MQIGEQPIVKMEPNVPRIIAAIYWVIAEANRRNRSPSQYDIVKSLFLADREHLNEWGRPITYDNYVAMLHGPVPSLCYNLLKSNEKAIREYRISNIPWSSEIIPNGSGKRQFSAGTAELDIEEYLSESDLEALNSSLSMVLRLGFSQIRRLTHEDPAYVEAWQEDGDRKAYDMKLELLFEEPNPERAQLLAEQSTNV